MSVMLIANNCTRESGSFCGDQLCALKTAFLFVENEPNIDRVIMTMSPDNEMNFLWTRFIETHNIEVIYDDWNPGDWNTRWSAWDRWRIERSINGIPFDHYRELYLRIHGAQRQYTLCNEERGLNRRNIYEYWFYGQEHLPNTCNGSDWFDSTLIHHPPHTPERDIYISPHCKTQGNYTFTFEYWSDVVHKLIDAGVSVTVGYDGYDFCNDLLGNPLYHKHWGNHHEWMEQICKHKMVACGNTGTGWLAAACNVPMITMEPHNSCMADHRYRQCGLKNIIEVIDGYKLDELDNDMKRVADYCARRIIEETQRVLVMTTGCYDVLHAGHIRHLQRSRALGTKLIVALNSDESVRSLKGDMRPINPQDQRKTVLEALRCVDEVRIFDGPNALPLIEELRPNILTAGFGYTRDTIVGRDRIESWSGRAVVTCTGDAALEPSTTKIVNRMMRPGDVAEICRQGALYSVNPFEKLKLMADEFLSVSHLPGRVADLGSYRGGSALILRKLAPDKKLYLFDTWQGNPFDDDLCHHKAGEWKADISECMKVVIDANFVQGIFPQETSREVEDREFCFIYVDMDTYVSTKSAINFFLPRLVKGGKLFFDDYGWEPCAGVKKAVDEMFPTEECEQYKDLGGIPIKRVVESRYACIIEKR